MQANITRSAFGLHDEAQEGFGVVRRGHFLQVFRVVRVRLEAAEAQGRGWQEVRTKLVRQTDHLRKRQTCTLVVAMPDTETRVGHRRWRC